MKAQSGEQPGNNLLSGRNALTGPQRSVETGLILCAEFGFGIAMGCAKLASYGSTVTFATTKNSDPLAVAGSSDEIPNDRISRPVPV